jgi:hypothetical protein
MKVSSAPVSKEEVLQFADELENVLSEIVNGVRKPKNIPLEPMIALIQFARDNATLGVTDEMVERFLNFAEPASYLSHPEVPYHGTANGDSEDQWMRRYTEAALKAALTPNV